MFYGIIEPCTYFIWCWSRNCTTMGSFYRHNLYLMYIYGFVLSHQHCSSSISLVQSNQKRLIGGSLAM